MGRIAPKLELYDPSYDIYSISVRCLIAQKEHAFESEVFPNSDSLSNIVCRMSPESWFRKTEQ